ncbi:MAG: zf-TFIIB domain-containing protein [Candidatus Cloacimonetes bacterium]|nr:zf-TFIIB domain-containing protein [Candidatus Cloacimonadota bacterium]
MKCNVCSAPMPSNSNKCRYCDTRNPIDLHGVHQYTKEKPDPARMCPHCYVSMDTLNIDLKGDFFIERCPECYGFFFDPGELDVLLENSVSHVKIDSISLDKANFELSDFQAKIQYTRCPICNETMQRINFGYKSGVVIDRCMKHGIWLESGELRHLFEWKKAGGDILDKKFQEQQKAQKKKREERQNSRINYSHVRTAEPNSGILSIIFRLFRNL